MDMKCAKCSEDIYLSNATQKWLAVSDGWPMCEIVSGSHTPNGSDDYDSDDPGDRDD